MNLRRLKFNSLIFSINLYSEISIRNIKFEVENKIGYINYLVDAITKTFVTYCEESIQAKTTMFIHQERIIFK